MNTSTLAAHRPAMLTPVRRSAHGSTASIAVRVALGILTGLVVLGCGAAAVALAASPMECLALGVLGTSALAAHRQLY